MRPLVLIIMDGWGINANPMGNATTMAATPSLTRLSEKFPTTEILTSGNAVGLPAGQMGNSEVGHLTLGAGRVFFQELTRIGKAMEDGSFEQNAALNKLLDDIKERGRGLHLMGLVSDGGVHSHTDHLLTLLRLAKKKGLQSEKVFIHCFLDGRDTPPESALGYMTGLLKNMSDIGIGRVATVSGRFYAMDRDRRWDRVKKAYDAIALGKGVLCNDPLTAIKNSYNKKKTDEFVLPTVITSFGKPVATLWDGDGVLFFNFRGDRARELTRAFMEKDFTGFDTGERKKPAGFMTMTEYDKRLNLPSIFPPQALKNNLGEFLSNQGVSQFRVSETEKYAHVTFFFNGGEEAVLPGEDRLLIDSVRDVPTYDLSPEMKAREIADAAVEKIRQGSCGFMLMNFANGDMVGHTGVIAAAKVACEAVDTAVGRVVEAAHANGYAVIITADHGNAEQMIDYETGQPHTAHTTNPVPLIIADPECIGKVLASGRGLADVAPTVLKIMGLPVPSEMQGASIV